MSKVEGESSSLYAEFVERLSQSLPGFNHLNKFLDPQHSLLHTSAHFTVFTINFDEAGSPELHIESFTGVDRLSNELQETTSEKICKLFLIENICDQSICLLGEHYDIDPQFFADHLNNEPWYRIENVAERIPALPSRQKLHDHLQLRFIETLTVLQSEISEPENQSELVQDIENQGSRISSDARSFMHPAVDTTNVPRKAGKLIPRERKGKKYETLLCTRQAVTIWFQKTPIPQQGWTGIVLLDPPFHPASDIQTTPTGYRSFRKRQYLSNQPQYTPPPASTREAFTRFLAERFSDNPSLLNHARSNCFLILSDLYRIVASNWVVINEYVNREMATIEYILEKEEPGFRDLEMYLKDLYIYRRRCTKYFKYIKRARDQCRARGQQSWPHDQTPSVASQEATDVEGDFAFLQSITQQTTERIEKNINLLTALVAIGEGKQGLDENHGIARLTLLATVFLPFSTVATMLSMQGDYAPGGDKFWLFWAVAIPITLFVLVILLLYDGFGLAFSARVLARVKNEFKARRRHDLQPLTRT